MELLNHNEFRKLFRAIDNSAFHLELRDDYHVQNEDEPFQRWLNGEPDDYQWFQSWLTFVRGMTQSGKEVRRLRVVTVPHTPYIQWELELTRLNVEAGEDVRYLPRHQAEDIAFPAEDCWLFDDDKLVLSLFKPDGRSGGFARECDPGLVTQYRTMRDQVWPRAIPYAEYVS